MTTRQVDNVIHVPGALILGAGLAGLFTALKLAPFPACIVAGARAGTTGSSVWAQGGIAAAMGPGDDWPSHVADTIAAGAGTTNPEIASLVAREASARIDDLVRYGAPFDRNQDGTLALAREAAHSAPRVVHVSGDRAGAEVTHCVANNALATPSISVLEGFHALELALEDGRVTGFFARYGSGTSAKLVLFRAPAIIFATGGLGSLYSVTTNPPESRGEGLGMAARAGALIADSEFVQFHPTALSVGRDPAPLATEALRGEGATLIDESGRRILLTVHQAAELAPRDVVARAIHREIAQGHQVFLDCRAAIGSRFLDHFPTVYAACQAAGIDPACEPIPVAPAAHYHMGGIASDAYGRTSLDGLWAVGECASTGLHGANRLASNSLLEALVFAARAAQDVKNSVMATSSRSAPPAPARFAASPPPQALRDAMSKKVGLERDAAGLSSALQTITAIERASGGEPSLLNMTAAAKLVAAAALARHESRGAHFRTDYPQTAAKGTRTFLTLSDAERIATTSTQFTRAAARS
ncbi:MAG: L-aspartate oxidase [Rhizomicrobium sp.]|jgi:L-aspartate oxidase